MVYKKTYFVCQSFDISPGKLDLGHIIASPSTPEFTLNGEEREAPSESEVLVSSEKAYDADFQDVHSESSALLAIYMRLLGLKNQQATSNNTKVTAKEIQTRSFQPDLAYLHKSMESPGVARFLSASRYRKPVYIVTRVKIARGANFSTQKQITLKASVDISGLIDQGIPISVGPQAHMSSQSSINFDETSDFVFAYTLKKIQVKRHAVQIVDYVRDAFLRGDNSGEERMLLDIEDAGADGLSNVVAETLNDDDDSSFSSVALYSAKE